MNISLFEVTILLFCVGIILSLLWVADMIYRCVNMRKYNVEYAVKNQTVNFSKAQWYFGAVLAHFYESATKWYLPIIAIPSAIGLAVLVINFQWLDDVATQSLVATSGGVWGLMFVLLCIAHSERITFDHVLTNTRPYFR